MSITLEEIGGNCDICPMKINELCPGGFSSDGSGEPIEPPCCGSEFHNGADIEAIAEEYIARQYRYEIREEKRHEQEKLQKEKQAKAAAKRKISNILVRSENSQIKSARKLVKALHNSLRYKEAVRRVDSFMTGSDLAKKSPDEIKLLTEIALLEKEILDLEEIKKNKQGTIK